MCTAEQNLTNAKQEMQSNHIAINAITMQRRTLRPRQQQGAARCKGTLEAHITLTWPCTCMWPTSSSASMVAAPTPPTRPSRYVCDAVLYVCVVRVCCTSHCIGSLSLITLASPGAGDALCRYIHWVCEGHDGAGAAMQVPVSQYVRVLPLSLRKTP